MRRQSDSDHLFLVRFVGCIFGELLQRAVTIPGDSPVDQLDKTFALVGTPTAESWAEYATYATKKVSRCQGAY